MSEDRVQDLLAEIIGKVAWHAQHGYSSFLTFEFGDPHLETWEQPGRRRHVNVRGQWHLWIHSCHWQAFEGKELLADSENDDAHLERAAAILDSQVLTAVEIDPSTAACVFRFDLGGRLETTPFGDNPEDEQWLLYRPAGDVLTLRADSTWSLSPEDERPADVVWRPLRSN